MDSAPPETRDKKPKRLAGPRTFLALNAVYLLVVYGASLWLYPLGKDYANMAAADVPRFPVPVTMVWVEMRLFGGFLPAYHLVNLALLFGTMVCLFFFTRHALRGPWWLGSLVAVLTMANPMKGEAVLRITGVDLLWPMLLSSAALLMLASHLERPKLWKLALVHGFVLAGPALDPVWRGMGAVLALYALMGAPTTKVPRWAFLSFLVYCVLPPYGAIALRDLLSTPHEVLGSLLLVFYPIGLLPETVARLDRYVWLIWAEVALVLLVLLLILRKAPDRGILFGLLGMLVFRLLQPSQTEDLVHMADGGRFLMPIALGNLALTSFFHRAAQHPKWARHIIMFTTVLCVAFFALQWREITAWYRAAGQVRAYQEQPTFPPLENAYHRTAPLSFGEVMRYDTPFSRTDTDAH